MLRYTSSEDIIAVFQNSCPFSPQSLKKFVSLLSLHPVQRCFESRDLNFVQWRAACDKRQLTNQQIYISRLSYLVAFLLLCFVCHKVMVKYNFTSFFSKLRNTHVQKITCKVLHTGPKTYRSFFDRKQCLKCLYFFDNEQRS